MPDGQGWSIPYYPGSDIPYTGSDSDLYLRKWEVLLSSTKSTETLSLSSQTDGVDFRVTFNCRAGRFDTPPQAEVSIYNLKPSTANHMIREYNRIKIQAGYIHGYYGLIFDGTIKQYKKGREANLVDAYLTIYASDLDGLERLVHNETTKPMTGEERTKYFADHAKNADAVPGNIDPTFGGTYGAVRGETMMGHWTDRKREWERTSGGVYYWQHGKMNAVNSTSQGPGDVIEITGRTGMIGFPEAQQDGIHITTLLNPVYMVHQTIKIDNRSLNQYYAPGMNPDQAEHFQSTYGAYVMKPQWYATTDSDGFYSIFVIDVEGDTRGMPWYSHLTCLHIDPTTIEKDRVLGGKVGGGEGPAQYGKFKD